MIIDRDTDNIKYLKYLKVFEMLKNRAICDGKIFCYSFFSFLFFAQQ